MSEFAIATIVCDHPAHRHLVAQLVLCMSDISEETWCAGWLDGLEFLLWDAIQTGQSEWIAKEDLHDLAELSTLVGGWHDGERFIPLDEWLSIEHEHTLKLRARDSR